MAAFAPALRQARTAASPLAVVAMVVAALIIVPVAVVIVQAFAPGTDTWAHLAATVLPEYIRNTLWLLVGVALGVGIIGTLSAWLVTTYRFRGSRILEWALVLPLAMPAYVVAYAYTDSLQFSGPVQAWLREMTGWRAREYWFPEIRSLGGAVALFILTLYPYVYLRRARGVPRANGGDAGSEPAAGRHAPGARLFASRCRSRARRSWPESRWR